MKDFYEQHNCIARFVRIHRADATGDGSNQPVQHLRGADKNWKAKQWQGSRPISVSSGSTRAAQLQPSGNNTARKLGRIRALLFLSIVLEDLSELFAHAFEIFKEGVAPARHFVSGTGLVPEGTEIHNRPGSGRHLIATAPYASW
jgi:hypothetical protein